MSKTVSGALGLVLCLVVGVANAEIALDDDYADGFVGRGDVISHPKLGKNALVMEPSISLSMSTVMEMQTFKPSENANENAWKVATKTFALDSKIALSYTKTANGKGVSNHVTGYILAGVAFESQSQSDGTWKFFDNGILKDVPTNWVAAGDIETLDGEAGDEAILTFDAGNGLIGSWLRTETAEGVVWVPLP